MVAPANDNLANAQALTGGSGSAPFDNTDATAESGEYAFGGDATLWYRWTAPVDGAVEFGTTGLSAPLGDYGVTLWADGAAVDAIGQYGYGADRFAYGATAGVSYLVQLGGPSGITGTLEWSQVPDSTVPEPTGSGGSYAATFEHYGAQTYTWPGVVVSSDIAALPTKTVGNPGPGRYAGLYFVQPGGAPVTDPDTLDASTFYGEAFAYGNGDGSVDRGSRFAVPAGTYTVILQVSEGDSPVTDAGSFAFNGLTFDSQNAPFNSNNPPPPADPDLDDPSTITPPPVGTVVTPILRVSPTMGPLTIDDLGRPVDWQIASTVREEWGTLRLFCGSTDVTYLRGVPAEVISYGLVEPFGYGPAEVAFAQISPFDTLGAGDLSWFVQGMNVTIKREKPDGTLVTLWEGLAASWEGEDSESGYRLALHCMGALFQAGLEPRPPSWRRNRVDLGTALAEAFNTMPGRRFAALPVVTTNVGTRNRGSWSSVIDYAQDLLSTAYNSDGTLQWTMGCNPGRFPTLHVKDRTTQHWSISVGTPGAHLRESSDITGSVNVIYGEGIADDGCRWRNSRYPAGSDRPVFRPLVHVTQNEPYLYAADGTVTGTNPSYDPNRLRVARYENFGAGVNLDDGVQSARAELIRDVNPGWTGTLTLKVDPQEGSRFDIKAGQNVLLRHHHGGNRLFHIAQATVDVKGLTVTLLIDTNGRDAVTVAGIRARDKAAAADPARRLNPPRRRSRTTPDEHPVFDCESGAGVIPATAVAGSAWTVIRVPASAYGQIASTRLTISPARRFIAGVFGKAVTTATLNSLVGAGLSGSNLRPWDANADDLSDAGLLIAWGDVADPAGYYPDSYAQHGANAPLSGRLVDDASWDFISTSPPWLWLAVYADGAGSLSGSLRLAPDGG